MEKVSSECETDEAFAFYSYIRLSTPAPLNLLLTDIASFEKLFRSQHGNLVLSAYRILNDKARAEDVVQDVFMKLWQKRDEISVSENLPAYLHRAVTNHAINIYKQQYGKVIQHPEETLEQKITGNAEAADSATITGELNERIEKAISTMPDSSRGVFLLSRFEEMSYKEISEQLEISVKTVEKHMSNALKHLRRFLPLIICLSLLSPVSPTSHGKTKPPKIFFKNTVGCPAF
jgi:RNA polymerase sigma-70 factor (ECF subfamily)